MKGNYFFLKFIYFLKYCLFLFYVLIPVLTPSTPPALFICPPIILTPIHHSEKVKFAWESTKSSTLFKAGQPLPLYLG